MKSRFVQEMYRFISLHSMIEDGEIVLVAVSGGADSIALLYGLHTLLPHLNCHLHVVHLDHSLRDNSATDAKFVEEHALRLGLPFSGHTVELSQLMKQWKLSIETAGRRARYQFFESVCKETNATKVALGHHKDDIAETVLMNLIRGGGSSGLKGILPIRDGKFIRPLAGFTRTEIEMFLDSENLVPRQDPTNTDQRYLRNRIRHELLPLLEQNYNPNIRTGLIKTTEILGTESEYLDSLAREAFENCILTPSDKTLIILDRSTFQQKHLALQRRILRHTLSEMAGKMTDFSFDHYQAILNSINGDRPNAMLSLPNELLFRRAYDQLIFERKSTEIGEYVYSLAVPGQTYIKEVNANITAHVYDALPADNFSIPDGTYEVIVDYEKVDLPLVVRNRRQGDRFQPHGMKGTKKIKDYMIDVKIPRKDRDQIPLLVCGNEILWVIGFTTNNRFKITPQTKKYLHLHYG